MKTLKKLACTLCVACSICFALTGCGSGANGSTSGNNDNGSTRDNNGTNMVEDVADNVGNAAEDVMEGAGNAVEDVADGAGNAVNDLVGNNGFNNYNDAHDYFMETMGNYHADAKFEIRDEDRNLTDYQEGTKGYRFNLYDTSKNAEGDMFGEFYVDAASGTIYQKDTAGNFTEYRGTAASSTTTNKSGTTHNPNANNGTGKTTGNAATNNNTKGSTSNPTTGNGTTNNGNISSVR